MEEMLEIRNWLKMKEEKKRRRRRRRRQRLAGKRTGYFGRKTQEIVVMMGEKLGCVE